MTDINADTGLSVRTKPGMGFFPFFRMVAASVLLAALLFKFSQVIAPIYHLQNTAFMAFLAYFYFALGRAVFVNSHAYCFPRKGPVEIGAAFGMWFSGVRTNAVFASLIMVMAGTALDSFIAPLVGREATHMLLYFCALIFWAFMAPRFLVFVGNGASLGSLAASKQNRTSPRRRDLWPAWLIVVLLIALLDTLGDRFVYMQLRAIVAEHLQSGRAIYLYSVSYFACLFWSCFWIQSWFVRLAVMPALVVARRDTHG